MELFRPAVDIRVVGDQFRIGIDSAEIVVGDFRKLDIFFGRIFPFVDGVAAVASGNAVGPPTGRE